jgi:hypothetical protein
MQFQIASLETVVNVKKQRIEELESERQAIEASAAETRGERDRLLLVLEIREQRIAELEAAEIRKQRRYIRCSIEGCDYWLVEGEE